MSLRRSRRARAALVAVTASAALLLSGCGGDTNVAARVDDHVVTEAEVASVVEQINAAGFQLQAPFSAQAALTALIRAPYFIDYGREHGYASTESAARASLGNVYQPSAATVSLLQADQVIQQLNEADQSALSQTFADLDVTVNPKYGDYDPSRAGVVSVLPPWVQSTSSR